MKIFVVFFGCLAIGSALPFADKIRSSVSNTFNSAKSKVSDVASQITNAANHLDLNDLCKQVKSPDAGKNGLKSVADRIASSVNDKIEDRTGVNVGDKVGNAYKKVGNVAYQTSNTD